jgi:hypothetical protein
LCAGETQSYYKCKKIITPLINKPDFGQLGTQNAAGFFQASNGSSRSNRGDIVVTDGRDIS